MNAVLDHLWQSTAFALLAPVVAFWLRPNRAHVRYLVWLVASIKFLIPFSVLIDAGSRLRPLSHYAASAILATAQSLGDHRRGRHVGLDFYDLFIEARLQRTAA